ncbi:unnamed protein product, partial [Ostreobium quekettii]
EKGSQMDKGLCQAVLGKPDNGRPKEHLVRNRAKAILSKLLSGVGAHCASRLCRVAMAPRHQRGPQLPFRLEREIEDRAAASSAPERLGRTHVQRRKFARKAARRDKKRIRGGWLPQTVPPVEQNSKREASKKRIGTTAKPKAALKQSSKKNKGRVAKLNATVKQKSKFLELTTSTKKKLLDDIEAENQYQKKLAKRLGADAKERVDSRLLSMITERR